MKKISLYWNVSLILFFVMMGCTVTDDIYREPLWPDIDLSLYRQYEVNWDNLKPSEEIDYWELRPISDHSAILKAGDKCKNATNRETCIAEFDALRTDSGFGEICYLRFSCIRYVVTNQGGNNRLWDTLEELKSFLGTIDSKEEAILLAEGDGFFISCAISGHPSCFPGGIREIDGEYEMIVQKQISFCGPHQMNRYLIRIDTSTGLRVLREQISHRNDKTTC